MCGRKTLTKDKTEIIKEYHVQNENAKFSWIPNYNIAPSQITPILIYQNKRIILPMQWGLIPNWAKDRKIGFKMINARSENISEKNTFSPLLINHRCIVITDGYYEWKNDKSVKQPFYIQKESEGFISMAGLWNQWQSNSGEIINSYTVVTTKPQKEISHIHNRMPAIISKENIDIWLNHEKYDQEKALILLKPSDEKLKFHPVSNFVNSTVNNSKKCIEKYKTNIISLF